MLEMPLPMPIRGKPSVGWSDYLSALVTASRAQFFGRNAHILDVRDARFNLTKPQIPAAFEKITGDVPFKSPLTRDLIRRAKSINAVALPVPKRIPLTSGTQAQERSSRVEKWLKAQYRQVILPKVWWQITDAQPADGEAIWKTSLRMHKWAPARKKGEDVEAYNTRTDTARKKHSPFVSEHVITETFFPVRRDEDGLAECFVAVDREAFAVADQYGLTYDPAGRGNWRKLEIGESVEPRMGRPGSETVEVVEYHNRTHTVVMVEGDVVEEFEHHYGRPPFYEAPFSPTSLHDPAYATESIADSLIPVQRKLEQTTAVQLNWGFLTGFPFMTLEPVGDEGTPEPYSDDMTVQWAPGELLQPPYGYRIVWRGAPPAGQDLTSLRDYFSRLADDYSLADILYGRGAQDVSGPVLGGLLAMAKAEFGPGAMSMAQAFDEQAAWMLEMVEQRIKAPVPLWYGDVKKAEGEWIELDKRDIEGYYTVSHVFDPVIPLEQQQQAILMGDAQARGAITMNEYRERGLQYEDPERMEEAVLIEQGANRPEAWTLRWQMLEQALGLPPPPPPQAMAPGPGIPVGPPGLTQMAGVQQPMQPGIDPTMMAPPMPNGAVPLPPTGV